MTSHVLCFIYMYYIYLTFLSKVYIVCACEWEVKWFLLLLNEQVDKTLLHSLVHFTVSTNTFISL